MGIFSIALASLLVPHRDPESTGDLEDLEKARRQVEPTADDGDDENEQRTRSPEPDGDVDGDNESTQDSDPRDIEEDDPEEPSTPGRRVTFGSPSREGSTPSEKGDVKLGRLARLKAILFPKDEDKPLSSYRVLPIISGLIIPFAILLEIPGLINSWYIRTDENVVVETRRNPPLLEVGLALSMFFALTANTSLICRFLEKGSVLVTTVITIVSLSIHGS